MHQFGSHTLSSEGEVLRVLLVGDVRLEDMQQLLTLVEQVIERHGCYGAILDTRQLGSVTPQARKYIGQWPGATRCFGNAVFGAGLATRTLLTLLARAIELFSARGFSVAFFRTEGEARVWL